MSPTNETNTCLKSFEPHFDLNKTVTVFFSREIKMYFKEILLYLIVQEKTKQNNARQNT